jgi:hypothetical protein
MDRLKTIKQPEVSLCPEQLEAEDPNTDEEQLETPRRPLNSSPATVSSPASLIDFGLSSRILDSTPSFIATPDTVYSVQQTMDTLDLGLSKLSLKSTSSDESNMSFVKLDNKLFKQIVGHLDDPRDIVRLSKTCRKYSRLIKNQESVIAMDMAKRQEPVTKILLENLYFDWFEPTKKCRYPKLGLAWIHDGITRSKDISQLATKFETMGLLAKYRMLDAVLPHSNKTLKVLRKQLSTALLGAEICAIKFGQHALDELLQDSQRTVLRALVRNMGALSAFWMVGLGLTEMKANGRIPVQPDSQKGRVLGDLLTGSLCLGANFMLLVLEVAPPTVKAARTFLNRIAPELFTQPPRLAVQKNIARFEFRTSLIENAKTRALVYALLGEMGQWKREIRSSKDWEETMKEIGWSIPMEYSTLEEREKCRMLLDVDSAGRETSRVLPLWFAAAWPFEG